VLLLDKPLGMSSNAALQKARWLFNAAKAGHTGTLDPLATGLLPLCFGEATKFAGELLDAGKTYRATLRLGITTDSADADGQVLEVREVAASEAQLRQVMAGFVGAIDQVPPMYSALKRDGKPLYEYARAGIELERTARRITIYRLELLSFHSPDAVIEVACSKGTYVRTLVADIGTQLGCGAHLTALCRSHVGMLEMAQAVSLETIEALPPEERDTLLLPPDTLLAELPATVLGELDTGRLLQGQAVRWNGPPLIGNCSRSRLFGPQGFIGVGEFTVDGWLQAKRLIATNLA
jgi:tRNA pseudouridine55 synthase